METKKDLCISYYEQEAVNYDARRFSCRCRTTIDKIFKATIYGFIENCEKILDAGSGTGRFARHFAQNGHNVIAMDTSPAMLEENRKQAHLQKVEDRIEFIQGDIENIPLEDNSIDAITCVHVMVHYQDIDKAIGEFCRILKPGGILVFELANSLMARTYNRIWATIFGRKHYSFTDYYHTYNAVTASLAKHNITIKKRKKIKKLPKFIMHTLICKCKLSFLVNIIERCERLNFGSVTIICGQKGK